MSGCWEIRFSSVSQLVRQSPTAAKPKHSVLEIVLHKKGYNRRTVSQSPRAALIEHGIADNVAIEMEDRYGHRISYLRVSITDRCNERCNYCMPRELQEWLPREEILSYEETLRLIRIAADLGVTKIRVTGGEPLTRRDVVDFIREIPKISRISSLGISTNGTLLAHKVDCTAPATRALRAAKRLQRWQPPSARPASNRSTSHSILWIRHLYAQITGRDFHSQVLEGIDAAITAGFDQIKLNCVLMRGRNEDQLIPLIEFAAERNLILRFIELMPVSTTEVLSERKFLASRRSQTCDRIALRPVNSRAVFSNKWSRDVLPNSGTRSARRIYRCDDEPAFLRELQQTAAHLRRKIPSLSRQLSRVRHHETTSCRRE